MAKSAIAFSPKQFSCWVKAETNGGTSTQGTSMMQLDVDSVSYPSLNVTQVLDVRTGSGRVLKDSDFFQDNTQRITELTLSGTMHEDNGGHTLLMQNICNDYTGNPAVAATYSPPNVQYENGDGSALANATAGDTMTIVIAGVDETNHGTGNVQVSNTKNLVFSGMMCTNFQLSADSGTEGGRLKFSATLQSGKKPVLNNTTETGGTYVTTDYKVFSTSSEHLVAGLEVVMNSFTVTIDNPAVFFGSCSNGYEGATRGAECAVTFDTQIKYDSVTKDLVHTFDTQSGATAADLFQFTNDNAFGIDIDNGILTNVAYSEGDIMMLDVSGKATSDGSTVLISFDCNE